jgi:hypothetical protein
VSSHCVVFWLWMTCSNLNAQNWIRIILQFVGGNVGTSAAGSKVFAIGRAWSLQTYIWGCNPGVVPSWKTSHLWQPKQSSFSMVKDTVDCQWEVAEGVLGGIGGTSAGRLEFLNFWPFARKLAFKALFLLFHCDIWEKMI